MACKNACVHSKCYKCHNSSGCDLDHVAYLPFLYYGTSENIKLSQLYSVTVSSPLEAISILPGSPGLLEDGPWALQVAGVQRPTFVDSLISRRPLPSIAVHHVAPKAALPFSFSNAYPQAPSLRHHLQLPIHHVSSPRRALSHCKSLPEQQSQAITSPSPLSPSQSQSFRARPILSKMSPSYLHTAFTEQQSPSRPTFSCFLASYSTNYIPSPSPCFPEVFT